MQTYLNITIILAFFHLSISGIHH